MPYQIKFQVIEKPKNELSIAEQKALQLAIVDATDFIENSYRSSLALHRKSGKTEAAIRKLVFKNKLSGKVFIDLTLAPWGAELMRGNKAPRVIRAKPGIFGRAGKMRFISRSGDLVFTSKVNRPRTFGLRIPEKMRLNQQISDRVRYIFASHLQAAFDGETPSIDKGGIVVR